MIPKTRGEIEYFGLNFDENIDKIREYIGICT